MCLSWGSFLLNNLLLKWKTNYCQARSVVSLMKLKPCVFIIIIIFVCNMFYNYLYYYQNALQTPTSNAGFTQRLYTVHAARPQCTHSDLLDRTTLPQRCHSALSNMLYKRLAVSFILNMLKTNATTWHSRRLHSAQPALLPTAQCVSWRYAIL